MAVPEHPPTTGLKPGYKWEKIGSQWTQVPLVEGDPGYVAPVVPVPPAPYVSDVEQTMRDKAQREFNAAYYAWMVTGSTNPETGQRTQGTEPLAANFAVGAWTPVIPGAYGGPTPVKPPPVGPGPPSPVGPPVPPAPIGPFPDTGGKNAGFPDEGNKGNPLDWNPNRFNPTALPPAPETDKPYAGNVALPAKNPLQLWRPQSWSRPGKEVGSGRRSKWSWNWPGRKV